MSDFWLDYAWKESTNSVVRLKTRIASRQNKIPKEQYESDPWLSHLRRRAKELHEYRIRLNRRYLEASKND